MYTLYLTMIEKYLFQGTNERSIDQSIRQLSIDDENNDIERFEHSITH